MQHTIRCKVKILTFLWFCQLGSLILLVSLLKSANYCPSKCYATPTTHKIEFSTKFYTNRHANTTLQNRVYSHKFVPVPPFYVDSNL